MTHRLRRLSVCDSVIMHSEKDPIVAIATASGRGGVGIVRISASPERASGMLSILFPDRVAIPRHAHLWPVYGSDGVLLDHALVLWFPSPASYTGESVIEIQAHGGPVLMRMIVRAVLERCTSFGVRLAEPGEFTKRAYLNGRMDLAQAEAVSDLIDAVSESAVTAATRSLTGDFSKLICQVGEECDELRAFVEASLDFPEEEVENLEEGKVFDRLEKLKSAIGSILITARRGSVLREGVTVALVGSPNVGKSSLLNALAGEDVAIVTDIAGTTRDKIEHWITIDGVPLRIVDTAGIRETEDLVEAKGIERTLQAVARADLVLHLIDASGRICDEENVLSRVMQVVPRGVPLITVANKSDEALLTRRPSKDEVLISARTGDGLDVLRRELLNVVGMGSTTDGLFMARERHLECLRRASTHLDVALAMRSGLCMMELLAEELRLAGEALGEIRGETTPDDILGMIFSKFCIGK